MMEMPSAATGAHGCQAEPFSAYVHIPFCATRCGYCDFNTYTNLTWPDGASAKDYPSTVLREIELSLTERGHGEGEGHPAVPSAGGFGPLATVFFGGGTPTLLGPGALATILRGLRSTFGLAPGAEITTEANPESVSRKDIEALAQAGFTRISFGMQHTSQRILGILERAHTAGQVQCAVAWARAAGLETSVDLIYGTPGETAEEWQHALDEALSLGVDHISAYALTIEPGTRLGRAVATGSMPPVDPDIQAERYEQAEATFAGAGLAWYEISNWARPGHECRHNLTYWRGGEWWGYGPGAHSHMHGQRWWNIKHPVAYARLLSEGKLPIDDSEVLTAREQAEEHIMLSIRLADGLPIELIDEGNSKSEELAHPRPHEPLRVSEEIVGELVADGLVELSNDGAGRSRIVLTLRGRLMADIVTRRLFDCLAT